MVQMWQTISRETESALWGMVGASSKQDFEEQVVLSSQIIDEVIAEEKQEKRRHHITQSGVYRVRCSLDAMVAWVAATTRKEGEDFSFDDQKGAAFNTRAASLRFRRWIKAQS
jgi:hypothetical protein